MSKLIKDAIFLRGYPNPIGAQEVNVKSAGESATLQMGMIVKLDSTGFSLVGNTATGKRAYVLINSEGDADTSPASPTTGGVANSTVGQIGKLVAALLTEDFEMLTAHYDTSRAAEYLPGVLLAQDATGILIPITNASGVALSETTSTPASDGTYACYARVLAAPALSGQATYLKVARSQEGGVSKTIAETVSDT